MKIFELKIKDEDHQIAILLSKEEAVQLRCLSGGFTTEDIKKVCNRREGYKKLEKSTEGNYPIAWHSRLYLALEKLFPQQTILEEKGMLNEDG